MSSKTRLKPVRVCWEVDSDSLAGTRINQSVRRVEQDAVQQTSQVNSRIADWSSYQRTGGC